MKQLNRVLTNPAIVIASGNLTFQTGASAIYFTQGGRVFGPIAAATAISLVGINIAPYSQAMVNVYCRYNAQLATPTTTIFALKGSEEPYAAFVGTTVRANYDVNDIQTLNKGTPVRDSTATYTIGMQVVFGNAVYQSVGTATVGTFVPSEWTLVIDINVPELPKALVTRILIVNNAATNFVGGTTTLVATGVSYVVFNETEVANQA